MEQLNDMMQLVGDELAKFANSNVVVGTPIEFSDATVVPISRISIGLGGGGAGASGEGKVTSKQKKAGQGEGAGGASTGAAKVRPIAVVVFTEKSVDVISIPEKITRRDKILEMIPDIVQKFTKAIAPDDEEDEAFEE